MARRPLLPLVASSLAAALVLAAGPMVAQAPTAPADPEACVAIGTEAERLACYDVALGRAPTDGQVSAEAQTVPVAGVPPAPVSVPRSLLDSRWELSPESKLGTFGMRAYQPVYVLPWASSRAANQSPSSPSHPAEGSEDLDKAELKFQISLKTKIWQGVFGHTGDLWVGYTQSSRWQIYDTQHSRPFRESDYEPEALLVFGTRYHFLGWDGRLLAVGLNHKSNGREDPRSRSWNRVTASLGLERGGWTVTLRPWWRIPEAAGDDDNPDIENYAGRADLLVIRHIRSHEFSILSRHSLRGGDRSRGALEVDWAFPSVAIFGRASRSCTATARVSSTTTSRPPRSGSESR